jgi:hypothetical protein
VPSGGTLSSLSTSAAVLRAHDHGRSAGAPTPPSAPSPSRSPRTPSASATPPATSPPSPRPAPSTAPSRCRWVSRRPTTVSSRG